MGLVYRSAVGYRIAMTLLEGREGAERRRRIANLIPPGASVVDLCCGDARIGPTLEARGCSYTGLDINHRFVRSGRRRGLDVRYWDAASAAVPEADVVCMLSSLYHFIPRERELFDRMVACARQMVVVSEPVTNWTTSGSPLRRRLARRLTQVNGRSFPERHSEQSLRALVEGLPDGAAEVERVGREVLLVVRTDRARVTAG